MDPRFTAYADSVCQQVRYATRKERAGIRKELTDHMEDHAQALLHAGYDADHAQQVALTHMGDPEEVGKALNRAYPKVWYILSRVMALLLILVPLLSLLLVPFQTIKTTWQVRTDPMGFFQPAVPVTSLDLRQDLPGGTVLHICGVSLEDQKDGTYLATVYTVKYQKDPLAVHWDLHNTLTFSSSESIYSLRDWNLPESWWQGQGVTCELYQIPLPREAVLTAHYDHYGTRFDTEIPLDWEEVTP